MSLLELAYGPLYEEIEENREKYSESGKNSVLTWGKNWFFLYWLIFQNKKNTILALVQCCSSNTSCTQSSCSYECGDNRDSMSPPTTNKKGKEWIRWKWSLAGQPSKFDSSLSLLPPFPTWFSPNNWVWPPPLYFLHRIQTNERILQCLTLPLCLIQHLHATTNSLLVRVDEVHIANRVTTKNHKYTQSLCKCHLSFWWSPHRRHELQAFCWNECGPLRRWYLAIIHQLYKSDRWNGKEQYWIVWSSFYWSGDSISIENRMNKPSNEL